MTDEFDTARRDARITGTVSFQLLTAVNRLTRPFHALYGKRFGVGLSEWRCMMALAAAPGASGEDVAETMGMDRMTVSRTLRRLEAGGHALRGPDPAHGRRNRWRLTERGWSVVDAVLPEALERDRTLFGDASPDERAALTRLLSRT